MGKTPSSVKRDETYVDCERGVGREIKNFGFRVQGSEFLREHCGLEAGSLKKPFISTLNPEL